MLRPWQALGERLGASRLACGIQMAEDALRGVACDAAGVIVASGSVPLRDATEAARADAFRALRAEAPRLGRDAVCCCPPSWLDVLPLRLPSAGGVEELLVERARQHLSYDVESAVLDYVGPQPQPDGTRRALLFALPRSRALELLSAAAHGGFRVRAIDSAGAALYRSLRHTKRLDSRRALVVHLDRQHWLFLVADDKGLYVERVLPWGEARLEAALMAQLEVPAAAAARLLRPIADRPAADTEVSGAAGEILAPALRELEVEVERVLGYCRAEFRSAGVDRVLLCGTAGLVPSVREALRRLAPEAELAATAGEAQRAAAHGLSVAYGLALRALLEPACAS